MLVGENVRLTGHLSSFGIDTNVEYREVYILLHTDTIFGFTRVDNLYSTTDTLSPDSGLNGDIV